MTDVLCQRCVIPHGFPGVTFVDGVCSLCQAAGDYEAFRAGLLAGLGELFESVRGRYAYDCVVAYSGGKDSSYVLKLLVEQYHLNCLAIIVDNGFMADQARANAARVTAALGVDCQIFAQAPDFMQRVYRESATATNLHTKAALTRASAVCNSCIGMINTYVLGTAVEKQVPIIAGGYLGGQVPSRGGILDVHLDVMAQMAEDSTQRYVDLLGKRARSYFSLRPAILAKSELRTIRSVNPMLALTISEEDIVRCIGELGWQSPKNTGRNSSNCLLNDLGIAVHARRFGFHPYLLETAEQVRGGRMGREEAIERMAALPQSADVTWQAEKIGLQADAFQRLDLSRQGAQTPGMLAELQGLPAFPQRYPQVREALGQDMADRLEAGDPAAIQSGRATSLLTVLASVLAMDGWEGSRPGAYAGYSVGQLTALYAAGCFDYAEVVRLTARRADLLDAAAQVVDGGMLGVIGVAEAAVDSVVSQVPSCWIGNYNCFGQYSLSGRAAAIDRAEALLETMSPTKLVRLPVAGPWHCPLMAPAAEGFAAELAGWHPPVPTGPVADNLTGR